MKLVKFEQAKEFSNSDRCIGLEYTCTPAWYPEQHKFIKE